METDPAFEGAGKEAGLKIWRIMQFQAVDQSPDTYGKFYAGDAYIILNTEISRSGSYNWAIHFWLGKDCSQDEMGTAAIKAVELDDALGGAPIQYREVQNHESNEFTSLFKKGITYLEGGAESGFTTVDRDEYTDRLLRVKGHRNPKCFQVPMKCSSLNYGDVFILDTLRKVFVWIPPECAYAEKLAGMEIARQIRDEIQQGKACVYVVDEKIDSNKAFFDALGDDDTAAIKSAEEAGDDREFEVVAKERVKLYRVSDDATGSVEVTVVEDRPLTKDLLKTGDSYILDVGGTGIYVWVGKKCSSAERKGAMQTALKYLEVFEYPIHTPVVRAVEEGEPPIFKQFFAEWPEDDVSFTFSPHAPTSHVGSIAKVEQEKFDASGLHTPGKLTDSQWCPDDGSGQVEVWIVGPDLELKDYPEKYYGFFFGGDSYVLKYTYVDENGKEKYIVYFWQGYSSSTEEKGAAAAHAVVIDTRDTHGAAVQVRVVQGKEPEHFLRIFKGKLVVFLGGHAEHGDEDARGGENARLFHIRGTDEINTRSVEVEPAASNLNSSDAFILQLDDHTYLWQGKGSSNLERRWARSIYDRLLTHSRLILLDEGEEPEEFWDALGGKTEYAFSRKIDKHPILPARLFHCSRATGKFQAEEILHFTQDDLNEYDVMMLDTYYEVAIWIGEHATEKEKQESMELALEYVESDPSGRTAEDTVIVKIKQGFEPPAFTGHFFPWDPEKWSEGKSFEQLKDEFGQANLGIELVENELAIYNQEEWSFEDLCRNPPPKGVDVTKKEQYLSDEEFQQVFNISKDDFNAKPQWKRIDLKKKAGLF